MGIINKVSSDREKQKLLEKEISSFKKEERFYYWLVLIGVLIVVGLIVFGIVHLVN